MEVDVCAERIVVQKICAKRVSPHTRKPVPFSMALRALLTAGAIGGCEDQPSFAFTSALTLPKSIWPA